MNQNKSNSIETDRKEIEQIRNKMNIKKANGMDISKDLDRALQIMSLHPAEKEAVDTYVNNYTKEAFSLLDEPQSDVPMGRIIQFMNIAERELGNLKKSCRLFMENKFNKSSLLVQYHKFDSACQYLSDLMTEVGDSETEYMPGLKETDAYANNVLVNAKETDICKYYDSFEHSLLCYDCLFTYVHKALETNDKALLNAVSFNMDVLNLYVHNVISFIENN